MMAVKLKGTVTVDHRLDLYARLSYCSPDTTATFLIHGMSPFMLWRHQQTQSSYRRPRQAPFFVPQAGARQVRYGSAVERGAMCDTLKGQRCSFGRQPSLAPLHEAYAHGMPNCRCKSYATLFSRRAGAHGKRTAANGTGLARVLVPPLWEPSLCSILILRKG